MLSGQVINFQPCLARNAAFISSVCLMPNPPSHLVRTFYPMLECKVYDYSYWSHCNYHLEEISAMLTISLHIYLVHLDQFMGAWDIAVRLDLIRTTPPAERAWAFQPASFCPNFLLRWSRSLSVILFSSIPVHPRYVRILSDIRNWRIWNMCCLSAFATPYETDFWKLTSYLKPYDNGPNLQFY